MSKEQLVETIQIALANALANLHTATIAKVTAVNETTINCQPVTSRVVNGVSIPLPEFVDVPPLFMQGGSSYTAHPIAVGDYALLIFTERCFDRWYAGQDNQPPLEFRMHDYSDGVAIVGLLPKGSAITIPNVITQIGDTYQEGNYEHLGNMDQTGDVIQVGDEAKTGDTIINGSLTVVQTKGSDRTTMTGVTVIITSGDVIADGISLKNHTHGGVQPGSGSTGVPQ